MKRTFYLATGAAIGVVAMRRLTRAARAWTPEQLAGRAAGTAAVARDAVRDFAADVRHGTAEREAELREALGLEQVGEHRHRDDMRN